MATLKNTTINDTGYLKLPSGTDAQRPGTPEAGMMRWNTTSSGVEVYDGTAWGSVGSSDADTLDGIDSTGFVKNNCSQTNHVLMFGAGYNTSHGDCAYAIFQEGGTWSYPYPDLRIAYHTGIKIGANTSYQGTRFYNDYNMATELFSVGNGDNNVRVAYNLYAPIFYDSNNTGYYVDPASTSNFNTICAANYCGLPASGGMCIYSYTINTYTCCTISPGKAVFMYAVPTFTSFGARFYRPDLIASSNYCYRIGEATLGGPVCGSCMFNLTSTSFTAYNYSGITLTSYYIT